MAPFTHVSTDRPSRFTAGTYGVLYAGNAFETALFETIHHHVRFMARTVEAPGWTSQFREIILSVRADLHDLRCLAAGDHALDPDHYATYQAHRPDERTVGNECVSTRKTRDAPHNKKN